jgi:hypothetical protein
MMIQMCWFAVTDRVTWTYCGLTDRVTPSHPVNLAIHPVNLAIHPVNLVEVLLTG